MKKIFIFLNIMLANDDLTAQKIESIYVNLYTDSLKKGTFNYINIDGLLSTGKYLPLDTTYISFWSSAGKFSGNNLWIDQNYKGEIIIINATLIQNPAIFKEFKVFIKKNPDPELKMLKELMNKKKSNN